MCCAINWEILFVYNNGNITNDLWISKWLYELFYWYCQPTDFASKRDISQNNLLGALELRSLHTISTTSHKATDYLIPWSGAQPGFQSVQNNWITVGIGLLSCGVSWHGSPGSSCHMGQNICQVGTGIKIGQTVNYEERWQTCQCNGGLCRNDALERLLCCGH